MALDFPTSPSLNDSYTFNDKTWVWDGTAWKPSTITLDPNVPGIEYNRWEFTGNDTLSAFSITGAISEPSEAYTVTIDATVQDPEVYTIDKDGDTIIFDSPPPLSSYIVVVEQYAYAAAAASSSSGVTTGKAIAMAIVFG